LTVAQGLIPLARGHAPQSTFAWSEGRRITVEEFVRDASRLASRLPERRHMLNLCDSRYRFAVGFAAALLRGQVSLLPPNDTPDAIERLVAAYPDTYSLTDRTHAASALDTIVFPDLSGGEDAAAAGMPAIPAAQAAAILFTSGSTGDPVPYPKTWRSLAGSARAEIERLELAPGLSVLGTVPPQHSYGLESTVLMIMQGGLAMHGRRSFFPADIRADLASLPRPRALVTTPVHLRVLLAESEALPPADLVLCATAPLSPQLAAQAEARLGAPLQEIYGCTEAGQIAARRTVQTNEWRTLPGVALRCSARGTWVRGGHVEAEVQLSDVIEQRGADRFLLHGRTADMVNIAGKRTSLAHLNFHLNSIEGVLDGVFVVPDEEGAGVQRLAAYVVAPGLTAEAVMEGLRQRIEPAFLPRPLCLVDFLPRNALGKLPREPLARIAGASGTAAGPGRP
jgi:acyl-coenzyme A synthetase/AMP-(fatty) acid ligase